jgi:hypothetical protein
MSSPVKLSQILERISKPAYWETYCLNKETGEIILITHSEFFDAEHGKKQDSESDDEKDVLIAAKAILSGDKRYILIPSNDEIDEYSIMERFCFSVEDDQISLALSDALKFKPVGHYFRKAVIRHGLVEEWESYLTMELRMMAKKWCEKNDIDFIEDI